MDLLNPAFALAALTIALLVSLGMSKYVVLLPPGRFASIDGMRGFLAFFVFLHHSSIWYFFLRGQAWKSPPSNFYTQLGESSVSLFFMITGFLFFTKMIDSRDKSIDWLRFYVARILRLVPLYLLVISTVFVIVGIETGWTLQTSFFILLKDAVRWLTFTILGNPALNGFESTSTIVARVTWSLPYEWLFYFALPVVALTVRRRLERGTIAFSIVASIAISTLGAWRPLLPQLLPFAGGIAASFLARSPRFCEWAKHPVASGCLLAALGTAFFAFSNAYGAWQLLLLTVVFSICACGNTVFGLLTSRPARLLGEMAYSIYLMHGIWLFVAFRFFVGAGRAGSLSPAEHWVSVFSLIPLLIASCYVTFRLVEKPSMEANASIMALLRKLMASFQKRKVVASN